MTEQPLHDFARTLIDDGQRDREALRERWLAPPWRSDVNSIAAILEQHPLLIPAVRQFAEDELERLLKSLPNSSPNRSPPNNAQTESHAD